MMKNSMALNYHENSKEISISGTFDFEVQYKIYPSSKSISLNNFAYLNNTENKNDFVNILLSRRSTRNFSDFGIALEELSRILTLSFGLNGRNFSDIKFRTYASAGARYVDR